MNWHEQAQTKSIITVMKKVKVMIVEDEYLIAMNTKVELNRLGYKTCKLVNTGEKAFRNVEQEKPDIVLMDINLRGEMDGIETAEKIRSHYGLPIIFLTSNSDKETRERAEIVGPIDYLTKPVEIEVLKQAIDNAFFNRNKNLKSCSDPLGLCVNIL